jgi:RND family efflux transporter MFP subunit
MAYKSLSESDEDEQEKESGAIANGNGHHISDVAPDEFDDLDNPPNLTKSTRRGWLTPALIGIGIGVAITFGGTRLLSNSGSQKIAPVKAPPPPSLSVTVVAVETSPVLSTLEATGTVAPYDLLPVLPQATGLQVRQVVASEGQTVQVGQVLAVLDDSVLQAQLQQAKAQLESSLAVVRQKQAAFNQQRATLAQTERELKRYQYLANQGAISRQDLETRSTAVETARESLGVAQANISSAEADVKNNRAQIQKLQTQLGQTVVRAPASGIVAEKFAAVGDVTSNQKLFTLIRNSVLELQVKIPETQLPQVRIGAPVLITSNADSRIRLQGTVREIMPTVDQQTRQGTVKINLPSTPLLRSGMFVRTAISSGTTQGLTVPATAVLPQSEGKGIVYTVDGNNVVHAQTVTEGATSGGENTNADTARIEIKSGLKLGDRIVVAGAGYLKDGDRVKVVSAPK